LIDLRIGDNGTCWPELALGRSAEGKRHMTEPNDKPTAEEIARAKEILKQEGEKPGAQQSGFMGVWGMILQMTHMLPKSVIVGALVVFLGYHAWDYYNAARRDPAETQEAIAKAAAAQAEADAQNKRVGNDTVRGAAVEAEMQKLRAEAAAAKVTTDALTQQINGLTAAEGIKRAELEKLANEARIAKADADAQTALLMEQRKAELAKTRADARSAEWTANYLNGTANNSNTGEGKMFGDFYDKVTGTATRPAPAPARTQEASREGTLTSLGATVVPPELKMRSCASFEKQCTEVLRLTQGQRVTGTHNMGNGWAEIFVQTSDGRKVDGFVNAKFLHFDGD
jgi:hypothetical protein